MKPFTHALFAALVVGQIASAAEAPEAGFTLGRVQQHLRAGMSQTELVAAIGSPNLLTRSADGREAWVYDKVSSETVRDRWSTGGGALGTVGTVAGLGFGSKSGDTTRTSQRTLTVVVRFTAAGVVESFTFHASRF